MGLQCRGGVGVSPSGGCCLSPQHAAPWVSCPGPSRLASSRVRPSLGAGHLNDDRFRLYGLGREQYP